MTTTHDLGSTGASTGPQDTGTADQAKQAASTAADQAQQVAGTASDEISKVADQARGHAQGLVDEARGQAGQILGEQATSQRDNLIGTLSGLGSDLRSMAEGDGGSGLAGTLARELADRAQALEQHLDGREPAALLDDVRRFARQRPGLFLAGALVAGVAAGRLARGAQAASSSTGSGTGSSTSTAGSTGAQGTAEGAPVPTVPAPAMGDSPLVTRSGSATPTHGDPLTDPMADPLADPLAQDTGSGYDGPLR